MLSLLVLVAGVSSGVSQTPAPPLQHPLDPAGDLILDSKGQPAEGSLPVAFVRSPDATGPDSGGRYLVVVNSGYGVQFTGHGNAGQQLLQVIDLMAQPAPIVVQSVYFPSPESVNVGLVFGTSASTGGSWPLYASGKVVAVIHRVFPLAEAAAAHALMESSQHVGKIMLDVEG